MLQSTTRASSKYEIQEHRCDDWNWFTAEISGRPLPLPYCGNGSWDKLFMAPHGLNRGWVSFFVDANLKKNDTLNACSLRCFRIHGFDPPPESAAPHTATEAHRELCLNDLSIRVEADGKFRRWRKRKRPSFFVAILWVAKLLGGLQGRLIEPLIALDHRQCRHLTVRTHLRFKDHPLRHARRLF